MANGSSLPHTQELVRRLRQAVPALAGVVLNQNTRDTNVILGPDYHTLWGRDFLEETLCGMTFRLSVPSFFQINRAQTERLYAQALDFAGLTGTETVLDLYLSLIHILPQSVYRALRHHPHLRQQRSGGGVRGNRHIRGGHILCEPGPGHCGQPGYGGKSGLCGLSLIHISLT